MTIREQAANMILSSFKMASLSIEVRNHALRAVADALISNMDKIIIENEKDLRKAQEDGLSNSVIKRLKFNEEKINGVVTGINDLIQLPDPLFEEQMKRELDSDLLLIRESCPIGVIGEI